MEFSNLPRTCSFHKHVILAIFWLLCLGVPQAQTVTVDASMSNQTLEGWGTSLAWFANGVGGWTNTTSQNSLMNALFSPSSGLGLNYLRYNIGGGDNPNCGTSGYYACISPSRHADPGYEPTYGSYDWAQDSNQRWVAQTAQSLGANLFEAISYSPPYWMTNSGTSEGGVNGAENLASGYYGSGSGTFADYLTNVAQHYAPELGDYLSPPRPNERTGTELVDSRRHEARGLRLRCSESADGDPECCVLTGIEGAGHAGCGDG